MRQSTSTLTAQELEIMKVIWALGTPTVREVYEELRTTRRIAYTTVMTMMNILEQKGYLQKESGEKAFVYTPSQPQGTVLREMVREFIDRVFNGAAEPLLLHLIDDEKLSEKDLATIRKMIASGKGQ